MHLQLLITLTNTVVHVCNVHSYVPYIAGGSLFVAVVLLLVGVTLTSDSAGNSKGMLLLFGSLLLVFAVVLSYVSPKNHP